MRPVKAGKSMRMSYSRQKEVLEMPNLIEVQKDSYQWFLDEGLKEVFDDISPIADYNGRLSLEFVDFALDRHRGRKRTGSGSSLYQYKKKKAFRITGAASFHYPLLYYYSFLERIFK